MTATAAGTESGCLHVGWKVISIISTYLNLFATVILTLMSITYLAFIATSLDEEDKVYDPQLNNYKYVGYINYYQFVVVCFVLVFLFMNLFFTSMLLMALYLDLRRHIWVYMVYNMTFIAADSLIFCYYIMSRGPPYTYGTPILAHTAVLIYMLIILVEYSKTLKPPKTKQIVEGTV